MPERLFNSANTKGLGQQTAERAVPIAEIVVIIALLQQDEDKRISTSLAVISRGAVSIL